MYVCVLLQAAGGGKSLSALGASVAAGPYVLRANVPLQVAGIGEDLVAVLAGELQIAAVLLLVPQQVGLPVKGFRALVAAEVRVFLGIRCCRVPLHIHGQISHQSRLLTHSQTRLFHISLGLEKDRGKKEYLNFDKHREIDFYGELKLVTL